MDYKFIEESWLTLFAFANSLYTLFKWGSEGENASATFSYKTMMTSVQIWMH